MDLGAMPALNMASAQLMTGALHSVIGFEHDAARLYGAGSQAAILAQHGGAGAAAFATALADPAATLSGSMDSSLIHFIACHAERRELPPAAPAASAGAASVARTGAGVAGPAAAPPAAPLPPPEPTFVWDFDLPAISSYILSRFVAGRASLETKILLEAAVTQATRGSLAARAVSRGAQLLQQHQQASAAGGGAAASSSAAAGLQAPSSEPDAHTPEGRLRIIAADVHALLTRQHTKPLSAAAAEELHAALADADRRCVMESVACPSKSDLDRFCADLLALSEAACRVLGPRLAELRDSTLGALRAEVGLGHTPGSVAPRYDQLRVCALPSLGVKVSEAVLEQAWLHGEQAALNVQLPADTAGDITAFVAAAASRWAPGDILVLLWQVCAVRGCKGLWRALCGCC
jgi:hypothetical protein